MDKKKYIIANTKDGILSDLQTQIMLDDVPLSVKSARSLSGLQKLLENDDNTPVILGTNIINDENFYVGMLDGHEFYCYAGSLSEAEEIAERNIKCIGIVKNSDKLIELLCMPSMPIMNIVGKAETKKNKPVYEKTEEITVPIEEPQLSDEQEEKLPEETAENAVPAQATNPPAQAEQPVQPSIPVIPGFTPEQIAALAAMLQNGTLPGMQTAQPQNTQMPQNTQTPPSAEQVPTQQPKKKRGLFHKKEDETPGVSWEIKTNKSGDDEISMALERDGIYRDEKSRKEKASVITVYAAKGGVGKTTIATELATYLSLTNNGANRLSVCVIDYNIDFGDVCSHLGLNPKGNTMVSWAPEIDALLREGESPDSISFTEAEIKKGYLQRMNKTGLYALLAPVAHEDSMAISDQALKIMLRNIVENGGFDYVIIDTGNNTRDAAIIALEAADHILLVATQDLTTANCNSAVLDVMEKMQKKHPGLNTGKINLIINNIIPANAAGVSTQDVEEAFPFECIAKIKRTPDIIKANNFSRPLIFNAKHEFTYQIQRIVQYITTGINQQYETVEKPKGFFSNLFKK